MSIPTTSETVVITSPLIKIPVSTCRVWITGSCQLTSGTGTTAVTVRIRRGTTTAGTLIGAGNSEAIKTAAGSTEPFGLSVVDTLAGADAVQYVLTLQQTAATGNGSVLQAALDVEVLNG
ncbi:MAG: hypothetical protein K6W08_07355 [Firmicutes bacterium]|nr:hypothetical protein [Bacillota bacterium]